MSDPRFSVVMPAYNATATVAEAIDSVRSQTVSDWELVVTDDGSTDGTGALLDEIAADDPRIRVVHQANGGTASALNAAIAESRGEYVCILAADDLYFPNYLESQAAFIAEHPGYDLYSCGGVLLYADGTRVPIWTEDVREGWRRSPSTSLREMALGRSIFGMLVARTSSVRSVGGYRSGVFVEDFDLWLRMLGAGFTHICNPVDLGVYRRHEASKSWDVVVEWRERLRQLEELPTSGFISGPEDVAALREGAAQCRARLDREDWIGSARGPEGRRHRLDFRALRPGFSSSKKYALEFALVLVSPRVYSAVMQRNRARARG